MCELQSTHKSHAKGRCVMGAAQGEPEMGEILLRLSLKCIHTFLELSQGGIE